MEHENSLQPMWYVAHTYSGYENKVKASIEATVEHRPALADLILQVQVPTQEVVETKDGKKICREKKLFPGYVMIEMVMTDESWYVVRNTRGVTGFVGPASKPVPLSLDEIKGMGIRQNTPIQFDFNEGDLIKVTEGPLEGFEGIIEEINAEKSRVRVTISLFGRETPAELGFEQIEIIK